MLNATSTSESYRLSLHDALPICTSTTPRGPTAPSPVCHPPNFTRAGLRRYETECLPRRDWTNYRGPDTDRKSTRLNSSHGYSSYAVLFLKKKKLKYY